MFKFGSHEVRCQDCGKSFIVDGISEKLARYIKRCDGCVELRRESERLETIKRSQIEREKQWRKICPPAFQNTTPTELPRPDLLDTVLQWQYGANGLLLHGPTGTGKSRCAWELCRREWFAGRSLARLDCFAGFEYASKFSDGHGEVETWAQELAKADILLLDDVLKAKLTDSFEAALFAIVTRRTEQGRPIIASCNDTGETLADRMSMDRGDAFVRRLREFCRSIAFTN